MKNKSVAAILAFFFGIFGMHRFYLGQRFLGMLYFLSFFAGMMLIDTPGSPDFPFLIALPAILGFVDSVLLAVMPKEDFDDRYNKKRLKQRGEYQAPRRESRQSVLPAPLMENSRETLNELKRRGIEKFRDFDFEGAVRDFVNVLKIKPEDPATHFNLACCYSILENAQASFYHLSEAVRQGFSNFEKVQNHDALAFLRTQPEYDNFVKNNYQLPANVQPAVPSKPQSETPKEETLVLRDDLLDQIIQLGELRNKGILTEEEFAKQKEKVLAQR